MIITVGKMFGELTVINYVKKIPGQHIWRCKCSCGKELNVRSGNLVTGNSKSCGHTRRTLLHGEAAFNQVYLRYKAAAKKKHRTFALTKEDFSFITQMNCHYCGAIPVQVIHYGHSNGEFIYNGIDRIDSDKGYTLDNVVPCCGICNTMKNSLSVSEFKEHIKRIIEYRDWN